MDLESSVRRDHPLRRIRSFTDGALESLTQDFARLYSGMGRPSIPPEALLRAMLLRTFYSIRSERKLMERPEFDLLFRCLVGLGIDDPGWDHSSFTKNRDRLLEGEIAAKFLAAVPAHPRVKRLLGPTPARRIAHWRNHLPRRRRNRLHCSPLGNFYNSPQAARDHVVDRPAFVRAWEDAPGSVHLPPPGPRSPGLGGQIGGPSEWTRQVA